MENTNDYIYGIDNNINDKSLISKKYWDKQTSQLWPEHEIKLTDDMYDYVNLTDREKEIYREILSFFYVGDGIINENIHKLSRLCTFKEGLFYSVQIYIETIHALAYSNSIFHVIKNEDEQNEIKRGSDNIPCIIEKTKFMKKYFDGDSSLYIKYIASACSEGIFFVSLFALVHFFTKLNKMKGFVQLNEQIAKDERLHRDYYCEISLTENPDDDEKELARKIIREAVEVELKHVEYLLKDSVYSKHEDKIIGMDMENFRGYIYELANDIGNSTNLGVLYNTTNFKTLPWMEMYTVSRKTNFYEGKPGAYKSKADEEMNESLLNIEDFDI